MKAERRPLEGKPYIPKNWSGKMYAGQKRLGIVQGRREKRKEGEREKEEGRRRKERKKEKGEAAKEKEERRGGRKRKIGKGKSERRGKRKRRSGKGKRGKEREKEKGEAAKEKEERRGKRKRRSGKGKSERRGRGEGVTGNGKGGADGSAGMRGRSAKGYGKKLIIRGIRKKIRFQCRAGAGRRNRHRRFYRPGGTWPDGGRTKTGCGFYGFPEAIWRLSSGKRIRRIPFFILLR